MKTFLCGSLASAESFCGGKVLETLLKDRKHQESTQHSDKTYYRCEAQWHALTNTTTDGKREKYERREKEYGKKHVCTFHRERRVWFSGSDIFDARATPTPRKSLHPRSRQRLRRTSRTVPRPPLYHTLRLKTEILTNAHASGPRRRELAQSLSPFSQKRRQGRQQTSLSIYSPTKPFLKT